MSETIRTADIIGRRLYDAGVRFAFGIPGGEVLTLIDGLEKAGIRFILSKHENAAGFMAEGELEKFAKKMNWDSKLEELEKIKSGK